MRRVSTVTIDYCICLMKECGATPTVLWVRLPVRGSQFSGFMQAARDQKGAFGVARDFRKTHGETAFLTLAQTIFSQSDDDGSGFIERRSFLTAWLSWHQPDRRPTDCGAGAI